MIFFLFNDTLSIFLIEIKKDNNIFRCCSYSLFPKTGFRMSVLASMNCAILLSIPARLHLRRGQTIELILTRTTLLAFKKPIKIFLLFDYSSKNFGWFKYTRNVTKGFYTYVIGKFLQFQLNFVALSSYLLIA